MPLDNPNSSSTRLLARLLVIAMSWGAAWVIGWFTGSSVAFYLIGALGTVIGVGGIVQEIRF